MATPTVFSNWPTFHHRHHNAAVPTPPELPPFHDNYAFSDTCTNYHSPLLFNSNHHSSTFNNGFTNNSLQFHNPINYPTLSSTYIPPITTQQQPLPPPLPDFTQSFSFMNEYYSNPIVPDVCDYGDFIPMNPIDSMQTECYLYPSYPVVDDVCCMEEVPPELPPMPEIYDGGGSSSAMLPVYGGGVGFNFVEGERSVQMKENADGGGRLSAQSMAARVRRRKISEKTSELGKLVPGGHRMTTAEMFQAAFKYIKFLQAQVGVLQLMPSSPGLGSELQALLTSPSVQEKLYAAGKCIVSQTLGESLADDHQRTKN
ncbi:hypothetical protein E3N88_23000 [Mikania micrantha]|uniref:BHLH domain-containing protein n=1 Tax=Mikania micrantha TaxID=192012 RepID=A0A5N6ND46_9ASTR|nr:hypothetical protein E3N88_23000 [Mikania micrantha]